MVQILQFRDLYNFESEVFYSILLVYQKGHAIFTPFTLLLHFICSSSMHAARNLHFMTLLFLATQVFHLSSSQNMVV